MFQDPIQTHRSSSKLKENVVHILQSLNENPESITFFVSDDTVSILRDMLVEQVPVFACMLKSEMKEKERTLSCNRRTLLKFRELLYTHEFPKSAAIVTQKDLMEWGQVWDFCEMFMFTVGVEIIRRKMMQFFEDGVVVEHLPLLFENRHLCQHLWRLVMKFAKKEWIKAQRARVDIPEELMECYDILPEQNKDETIIHAVCCRHSGPRY